MAGDTYQCRCLSGFTGDNCGVQVDECASTPCLNGQSISIVAVTVNVSFELQPFMCE